MRKPIYLSKNTVALIHLFTRYDEIEDIWMYELDAVDGDETAASAEAAKEFVAQLHDKWNRLFMIALRDEINILLKKRL